MKAIPLGSPTLRPLQSPLRLSTWNVCFDKYLRPERNIALLKELETHRPDIMLFQEVTLPFVRALQDCQWLKNEYWVSAVDHNQIGVVMVGRIEVENLDFYALPSQMGRRLLVADFAGGIRIASAHFESNRNSGETRKAQFEKALSLLGKSPAGVLLGDFNSTAFDPESEKISALARDAWTELRPEEAGYTFDGQSNTLAKKSSHSAPQLRIDRILCFGQARPISVELLGLNPFRDSEFASDHYGLLADVSFSAF